MKTTTINLYGEEESVMVVTGHYNNNNSLAVMLETDDGEPFATLTVNLSDGIAEGEYQYVDTNNCPWAEDFIKENGLGTPMGIMGYSGYCQYPLYRFNLEAFK